MKTMEQRNRELLLGGISILLGLTLMRLAWIVINQQWGTVIIIAGSILFLAGVIFSANTFFNRKKRH